MQTSGPNPIPRFSRNPNPRRPLQSPPNILLTTITIHILNQSKKFIQKTTMLPLPLHHSLRRTLLSTPSPPPRSFSLLSLKHPSPSPSPSVPLARIHTPANDDDGKTSADGGGSTTRRAVPFEKGLVGRLTPTLRGFTLGGKVVVVTGYVFFLLFFGGGFLICWAGLGWAGLVWFGVCEVVVVVVGCL